MRKDAVRRFLTLAGVCTAFFAFSANEAEAVNVEIQTEENQTIAEQDNAESEKACVQNGIQILGQDAGGKSEDEARQIIDQYVEELKSTGFVFVKDGQEIVIPLGEMGLSVVNEDQIIREAIGEKHIGTLIDQYKQKKDLEENNSNLCINCQIDQASVIDFMIREFSVFGKDVQEPNVIMTENGFSFVEAQKGYSIDYDACYNAMVDALSNLDGDPSKTRQEIFGKEIEPKFDDSVFEGFGSVLGEWTTEFDSTLVSRSKNIKLSTSKINGTVLMPGEVFSFCKTVQPFTEEEGYENAGTYMSGQVISSLGGGVCQVSTTLYDAVLWSELEVVFRASHSMTVSYVDPAMDAMVYVQNGQDFQFKNNLDHAVYIEAYTQDNYQGVSGSGAVTFRIFGTEYRSENRKVVYAPEVLTRDVPDPICETKYSENIPVFGTEIEQGQQYFDITVYPHMGMTAELYKEVYENGELVSREKVPYSYSKYSKQQGVIVINPDTIIKKIEMNENYITFTKIEMESKKKPVATQPATEPETETEIEETTEDITTDSETEGPEETETIKETDPPETDPPETDPPTTDAPTTEAPTTPAQATQGPDETSTETASGQ